MSSRSDPVDELTLQFRGLNIRISRARSSSPDSARSFEVVEANSGAQASTGTLAGASAPRVHSSAPAEEDIAPLNTPAQLNSVDIGTYAVYSRHLSAAGDWTAQGRIARAIRAGYCARDKLEGSIHFVDSSPRLPLSNRWYICLRCERRPDGFATQSFQTYRAECFNLGAGRPELGSVSHAFPSSAEGQAYCQAAGRRWPVVL